MSGVKDEAPQDPPLADPADVSPTDPEGAVHPLDEPVNDSTSLLYLTNALRALQADAATLHDRIEHGGSGSSGGGSRQPRLPHPVEPKRFDGTATQLRAFLKKARIYLSAYRQADEQDRLRALSGFLEGVAFEKFYSWWQGKQDSQEAVTAEQGLAFLESWFADQNEKSDATYRFMHARQLTNQSVLEFSNYLDQLLCTPGLEDLRKEHILLDRFWSGIHPSIRRPMLIVRESLKTRDDALHRAIDIERDLQQQRRFQQRTPGGKAAAGLRELQVDDFSLDPYAGPTAGSIATDLAEVQASLAAMRTEQKAWQKHKPRKADGKGPPPGQPLTAGKDGKKVPVQCYKCKDWGHYQSQCPGKSQPGNG